MERKKQVNRICKILLIAAAAAVILGVVIGVFAGKVASAAEPVPGVVVNTEAVRALLSTAR